MNETGFLSDNDVKRAGFRSVGENVQIDKSAVFRARTVYPSARIHE